MNRGTMASLRAELARIDAHILEHTEIVPGHIRLVFGGEMEPMVDAAESIVEDFRPIGVRVEIAWVTSEEYRLMKALKGVL